MNRAATEEAVAVYPPAAAVTWVAAANCTVRAVDGELYSAGCRRRIDCSDETVISALKM